MTGFSKEYCEDIIDGKGVFRPADPGALDKTLNSLVRHYGIKKITNDISGEMVGIHDKIIPGDYTVILKNSEIAKLIFRDNKSL